MRSDEGLTLEEVQSLTGIDLWFLAQIAELVEAESEISAKWCCRQVNAADLLRFKRDGFSDARLASLMNVSESEVRARRHEFGRTACIQAGGFLCGGVCHPDGIPLFDL